MASPITRTAPALPRSPRREPADFARGPSAGIVAVVWLTSLAVVGALVCFASALFRDLSGGPSPLRAQIGIALLDPSWKNRFELVLVAISVVLAVSAPRFCCARLRRFGQAFTALAVHRTQAIVFAGLAPMVIRAALLPILPAPQPFVADEFGYLLLADTLLHGRLANPTHPFWPHFESIYVLQHPTYASIYPVAPALLLVVPRLFGLTPWLGVWLGVGLMCSLLCWMLQGWLPPRWALAGALAGACRFGIVGPWMNSYWGGAAAAAGGALAFGALPRILRTHRMRDSLLFALGLAVLAQSRPYEGFVLGVPLVAALGIALLKQQYIPLRVRLRQVVCPVTAAMLVLLAGTAYYNWRVTGSPLVMPYTLHQKVYGTPQSFYWQRPILDAPGIHRSRDIADVFQWQLGAYKSGFSWSRESDRLAAFWNFYLQPVLTVPLLFLPFFCRRRRLLVALVAVALVLAANSLYPFFFPHYAAPICAVLLLLVVQGWRRLRLLRFRSAPVGRAAAGLLVLSFAVSTALAVAGAALLPWNVSASPTPRSEALARLQTLGGKHMVLVRYGRNHSFHLGVVFNDADIDRSPVVWARELDDASNRNLLAYFQDRDAWLFEPDAEPPRLVPLPGKPFVTAVADGAGRRDDRRTGVSPGSIALVIGANFISEANRYDLSRIFGTLPVELCDTSPEQGLLFSPGALRAGGDAQAPLPFQTGGTSVDFGGVPAPILGLSRISTPGTGGDQALVVQVPFELPPGWTAVTVRSGGVPSTARRVLVLPATPGAFQVKMADGRYRALLLHGDGSLVDLEHPARRGETLHALTTGLGPLDPPVGTNSLGGPVPSKVVHELIIGVNDGGVPLVSATYRAGTVGVEDVAFRIPADARTGNDIKFSVGVVLDGRTAYSNQTHLPIR